MSKSKSTSSRGEMDNLGFTEREEQLIDMWVEEGKDIVREGNAKDLDGFHEELFERLNRPLVKAVLQRIQEDMTPEVDAAITEAIRQYQTKHFGREK
ncbi:MAG: hypothetical protein AAGE65_11535 [Planctomycetota bacterium]